MSERSAADVDAIERDVDAVLRRLPVRDTYRANMFRVTGVLTDATPAQIRRRREEVTMAARLGTALPSPFGDLAPKTAPDADEVKAAFEAMQSPVLRLVHEALWLSGVATHDAAVAAHTKALDHDADDTQWQAALVAWARTLDDDAYWFRLERRAKELDDPRVSVATVVALRTRLPRRVLAPNAERATAAASAGDNATVVRHLELLHAAPFPPETVAAALREACNPVTDRIHDECAAITEVCADDPSDIVERCTHLLAAAPRLLAVPAAVLPAADGLSNALHDEIANTVARAAVAWVNDGGDPALVQSLLDGAADLARERTTVDLVERTRRGLAEAAVLAVVEPWLSAGNPDGAVEVLHRWRRRGVEPHLADEVARVAGDPRAIRAALEDVPTRAVFAGCGVRPYGQRAYADDTWVETRFVTVFFAPVYPLGSYLSDEDFVYARVPMTRWVRGLRLGLPIALVLLVCLLVLGPLITLAVGLATAAVLVGAAGQRRRSIDAWLAERTGGTT